MNIILIIGLPGSGKTHLGQKLQCELPKSLFIDDASSTLFNYEIWNLANSCDYENIILADCYLCISAHLEAALNMFINHNVTRIYFENNPEQCLKNVQNRDNRNVDGWIKYLAVEYIIPHNVNMIPVYKPECKEVIDNED